MKPLWHPVSGVLLDDPPVMAGTTALRMLLRGGPLAVRYVGDRMAPALRHGDRVPVRPGGAGVEVGGVVLAVVEGGGALDANESEPGPIMLQGDHEKVWYRKVTVTPITDARK